MDIQKPNDIFAAVLQKDDLNLFDVAKSKMDLTNTQLLSPKEYKDLDKVQKMFSTSGAFDESAFNTAYLKAAYVMQDLSLGKTIENLVEYDPTDFGAPKGSKKIDVRPIASADFNPEKNKYSWTGVNTIDSSGLSRRELAQQGKVFDLKNNKWLDKSASDLNIFQKFFGDTLVYAQWDEDGISIDPISGTEVAHKKGDWKYDEDGSYYTEFLGGREAYNKQIVNPMDLLTKEDTWLNRVDFFDSDGKEKSTFGTSMKLMSEIAPYLIPGFNIFYGGLKAASTLAGVLPTFYKAGEGLLLGEQSKGVETNLWRSMNSVEGFMSKYTAKSFSDKSSDSMWNYEQLGSIVTEVFSQIYQQRAAASLSKLLYKVDDATELEKVKVLADKKVRELVSKGLVVNKEQAESAAEVAFKTIYGESEKLKKMSDLSRKLSVGYMALVQSGEVYGEALEAGYDRRTAGFTALAAAAGQFGLMSNNELGSWFLDKSVGYTEGASKAQIRKLARSLSEDAAKGMKTLEVDKVAGKAALGNAFSKFKNKLKDAVVDPMTYSTLGENLWKKSIIEGVEEVSEEIVIDMAKGIADVMGALGLTAKKGSFGGFRNVFSSDGLQRYLSNMVGGMIGGPLFELERSVISPMIRTGSLPPEVQFDVFDAILNGRTDELLKELDRNKGSIGSTTLSPVVTELNGEKVYLPTTDISQADVIVETAKAHVRLIDNLVNLENLGNTKDEILTKSVLDQIKANDIRKSGVDKFILSDANELGLEIINLRDKLNSFSDTVKDSPEFKEILDQLNEKREEYTELITGQKEDDYHELAIFTLNPLYHSFAINLSPQEYVLNTYNKVFEDLTEIEKEKYTGEFKTLMAQTEGDYKNKMKSMFKAFKLMQEQASKSLKSYDDDGYASIRSKVFESFNQLSDSGYANWNEIFSRLNEVNKELESKGFPKYSLDTNTQLDMAKFLTDNGYISLNASVEHQNKLYEENFNELSQHFNITQDMSLQDAALVIENSLKESPSNILETANQLANINNKLKNNESLSKEELSFVAELGISLISENNSLSNTTNVENIENAIEHYNDYSQDLRKTHSTKKSLYDSFLEKLDTEPLHDNFKEVAYNFLKVVGIPVTGGDPETIQEIINKFLPKFIQQLDESNNIIQSDEEKSDEEKLEFQENNEVVKTILSNLKVTKKIDQDELSISAKRQLLLEYGRQLKENNLAVDNIFLEELEKEYRLTEDIINKNRNNYDLEDSVDALFNDLNEIDNLIEYSKSNLKVNQLLEILKKFEISLLGFKGPESFFQVIQDNVENFSKNVTLKSDFIRSDVQIQQIERASYVLEAIGAVLNSMSTSGIKDGNLYGMNVMMNKYLEKKGENPKYEFVDDYTAEIIRKDLNIIKSKVDYLLNLAKNNAVSIVEGDNQIRDKFFEVVSKQYLDKDFKVSLINLTFDGKPIFSSDDLDKFNSIDDIEQKIIEIEETFYNNFHKLPGTIEEKLNSVFSAFINESDPNKSKKDIIESQDSSLTADFNGLELSDWYNWLHTILGVNSKRFYQQYKKIVENSVNLPDEFKKAPLFTQMVALRQALTYIENKEINSHIANFLVDDFENGVNNSQKESINKLVDNLKETPRIKLQNMYSIRGSGGVGKSSVLANSIIRILINEKLLGDVTEIQSVAPTKSTLETLNKELKGNLDVTIEQFQIKNLLSEYITEDGMKKLILLEKLISETDFTVKDTADSIEKFNQLLRDNSLEDYFVKGEGLGVVLVRKQFYEDFKKPLDPKTNKLIVGDEGSKINTIEWQIINQIANNSNIRAIILMDELQNGVFIGKNLFSIENLLMAHSIKLKNPIRSRNTLQSGNNITLENWVYKTKRRDLFGDSITVDIPEINYNDSEGNFLTGTKLVKEISNKDLEKFDKTKEIAVITQDGVLSPELSSKLKEVFGDLMNNVKVYPIDVQGQEFDQVIIDVSLNGTYYDKARNIYTLLTRAKEATLAKLDNSVEIKNNLRGNSRTSSISLDIVNKSIEDTIERLNKLDLDYGQPSPQTSPGAEPKIESNLEIETTRTLFRPDIEEPGQVSSGQTDGKTEAKDEETNKALNKNNIISYSFFNNLGIYSDNVSQKSDIEPYLEFTISDIDDIDNKKITWNSLKNNLKISGTDLFSIPNIRSGTIVKTIISDYIRFKNAILFNKTANTDNLFYGNILEESSPNWIIKKIYDKSSSNYLSSYGKLVGNTAHKSNVYAIGTYVKFNDSEPIFITLAVTPDLNNPNVAEKVNIDKLQKIYDEANNHDVFINKHAIKTYRYPVIPINKTSSDRKEWKSYNIPEFTIDKLEEKFPGAKIVDDKIRVFRGNTQYIKDQFNEYLGLDVEGKGLTEEEAKKYRFRPYVIIEYLEGSLKHRRIVLLKSKVNDFSTLWEDFLSKKSEIASEKYNGAPKHSLISKYKSWEVLFDYLSYIYNEHNESFGTIINQIEINQKGLNPPISWDAFEKVIKSLKKYNFAGISDDWNKSDDFKRWYTLKSKESKMSLEEILVRDLSTYTKTDPFSVGNALSLLVGLHNKSDYYFDDFLKIYNKKVYSNPTINSIDKDKKGAGYGTLSDNEYQFYTINIPLESNRLIIDLTDLAVKDNNQNTAKVKVSPSNVVPSKRSISFLNLLGKRIVIEVEPNLNSINEVNRKNFIRDADNISSKFINSVPIYYEENVGRYLFDQTLTQGNDEFDYVYEEFDINTYSTFLDEL